MIEGGGWATQFRVRSIIITGAFAAAMIGAVMATAASGSGTPLVWRSPASARYVVPLPRTWKLRTVKTTSSEIDRWSDPNDRAARLLVTISDCARCVATHGQPNPKALVPKGLRVTSVGNGHAAFMGSTAGDKYEEHGLVIITRDSRGTISGATWSRRSGLATCLLPVRVTASGVTSSTTWLPREQGAAELTSNSGETSDRIDESAAHWTLAIACAPALRSQTLARDRPLARNRNARIQERDHRTG